MDPRTLIIFIFAFGGMVIIHEFGHFIAARLCNIEVEEFGIGLPTPGAIKLFTWKGTRFTLNWLPLGGFVRPKGENDPTIEGGLAAASPWKRLLVLVAGPVMNLLTAFLIYSFIVSRAGAYEINKVLISSVVPDGAAAQAGFQAGDIFITGNGQTIQNFGELSAIIGANEGKPVHFLVDRKGQQVELTAIPHMDAEMGRPIIGVSLTVPHRSTGSVVEDFQWGARYSYNNIYALLSLPAKLIRGTLPAEQSRLVGLKGIYDIMEYSVQQGMEASAAASPSQPFDWYIPTLEIIAALSISLGVFNLFPFPALDGGRIIFVLPELITRRRVPAQFENLVHGLGMTFLLLFMIYVNVMDFVHPVNIP